MTRERTPVLRNELLNVSDFKNEVYSGFSNDHGPYHQSNRFNKAARVISANNQPNFEQAAVVPTSNLPFARCSKRITHRRPIFADFLWLDDSFGPIDRKTLFSALHRKGTLVKLAYAWSPKGILISKSIGNNQWHSCSLMK